MIGSVLENGEHWLAILRLIEEINQRINLINHHNRVLGEDGPSLAALTNSMGRFLGHRGGRKGGLARAASMTPEARREVAKKAAKARWGHSKEPPQCSAVADPEVYGRRYPCALPATAILDGSPYCSFHARLKRKEPPAEGVNKVEDKHGQG